MKFKFESDLAYQLDAIDSVINLFNGQKNNTETLPFIAENAVIPNEMDISDNKLLENLIDIQKNAENIRKTSQLEGNDFSIEMETGTGKTYVYLRTILELNKNYGFKKFIIIVPSVAIREGVLKTLDITRDHFRQLYNIPYNFYEYDSGKLMRIGQFARNNNVEIVLMTLDSFNKDTNIMNQSNDKLFGQKPIDLVSRAKPILILDEPQNMESDKAKDAISRLNPLFKLRYSATHRKYYNLLYRLTPLDAYNNGLVKKIEVDSVVKENDFNNAYVRCLDIKADSKGIKCQLEVNKKQKSEFKVGKVTVKNNDDLLKKTKAPEYEDFIVTEINANYNFIRFSNGMQLKLGEDSFGDRKEIMRVQIQQTIQEHFLKQKILKDRGIKVLSLFFIDKVSNYQDEDGFIRTTFEDEFEKIKPHFEEFKDLNVKDVHKGYFSSKKSDSGMENDKKAFDLIMRHKEKLLSFKEPTQFIFSHSALKEGWDNPNVFNICTLNQTVSNIKKRQEIGRGVRLPVDHHGDRIKDSNHNVLTVIANESYAEYVKTLQTEYIEEYGEDGLPPQPAERRLRKTIKLKKEFQLKPEFKELWDKISKKTRYSVDINTDKLIEGCIEEIDKIDVETIKIKIEKVSVSMDSEEGIVTHFVGEGSQDLVKDFSIPNVIERISTETSLTKNTIHQIISGIDNLDLIFTNPQDFINSVSLIIKFKLKDLLVNGIQYIELDQWWQMEFFDNIETYENKCFDVNKSIYDAIKWDSQGERTFARQLDRRDDVRLFIKLPDWFKIQTPIGGYNPDWAVVVESKDLLGKVREKLYLVRETKFFRDMEDIRDDEKIKINCAEKHFKTIGVDFKAINDVKNLI